MAGSASLRAPQPLRLSCMPYTIVLFLLALRFDLLIARVAATRVESVLSRRVAPHYGLCYGFAPATGNFRVLRGRPPFLSPVKSYMGRSFTEVIRV